MNNFSQDEIKRIIDMPDSKNDNEIHEELLGIIYSLGRDAETKEEYIYSFNLLCELCNRVNAKVRTHSILGLSLLCVYHKYLDIKIVKPIIENELLLATAENRMTITDAVDDINHILGWNIKL